MRGFFISIRLAVLAAVLALSPGGRAAGAEASEKAKPALSPEREKALGELLKKAPDAKRKVWAARMKKEIEQVTKATGLNADGAKALEAAAGEASEACVAGWLAKFGEGMRTSFSQYPEGAFDGEELLASQLEQTVQYDWFGEYVRPFEHPKWTEALRRTLSAEQLATWEKTQADRRKAVLEKFADAVKRTGDLAREQSRIALLAKATSIRGALALSKERSQELDKLAEKLAEQAVEPIRARAEKIFLSMDDDTQKQELKDRGFYIGLNEADLEKQQAAWKDGVAKLLTAGEVQRIEETRENLATRRARALGQILLAQLDEKVAFTASQRERLLPVAERLVKEVKALFPDGAQGRYFQINSATLLGAGRSAVEEEMTPILDANQWRHWQTACSASATAGNRVNVIVRRGAAPAPAAAAAKPRAAALEPEEVEHAFSDFLHEKAAAERTRLLAASLLKAEDVARVAALPAEALARLETAARGAAEELLAVWKTTTESAVRGQVRDAVPETIRQRLAAMESYTYTRNSNTTKAAPAIWEKTAKAVIPEPAQQAWQKELDARAEFRERAIAAVILSEFDRRFSLASAQWSALEPVVGKAIHDYAPDIGMMFSSANSFQWYLQSYTMFIPFAATPEAELKRILGKEQWTRWSESEECGNTGNYWENIQRYHTQRMKEKK